VVSVGNIFVGGTGKSAAVVALVKLLWRHFPDLTGPGKVAILSRGYGRISRRLVDVKVDMNWQEAGDEPLLHKRLLQNCAVIVHADRVLAARYATKQLGSRLLLLDDGFQHRRLARDLDIVLVDGQFPLGNGYVLPAGPLRESPKGLDRASLLIGVGENHDGGRNLASQLKLPYVIASTKVTFPRKENSLPHPRVVALASIARPARFVKSLKNNGYGPIGTEIFPDHHRFRQSELEAVEQRARSLGAEAIVTTSKDLVRLGKWSPALELIVPEYKIYFEDDTQLTANLTRIMQNREK
jgi:tetraacyldisaccharide 4'-kinase